MSLFTEGSYDKLEFNFPVGGMNQNISPYVLQNNFSYILENMISLPLGRGSVRFGTKLLNDDLLFDSSIMEGFSFLKTDGNEQVILYVNDLINDPTIDNINIIDVYNLSFTTDNPQFYQKDTKVKLVYSGNNFVNSSLYANISVVNIVGTTVTLTLGNNYFPAPIDDLVVSEIHYSVGNIYNYDVELNTLSAALNDDYLSVACVPRTLTVQNTLLICNGVDKLMSWNGISLNVVTDYVNEITANSFNRIGDSSFSFLINPNLFILGKYQPQTKIVISVNDVKTNLVINTVNLVDNLVTITTTTPTVPAFTGQDTIYISYADYPPPFNYLFSAHNRIWALGPGAVSIDYRSSTEALKVYWTDQPNSFTSWFNEQTKLVAFEDLSDEHGIPDNLEAICAISGYLAFIGRHKTQLWQGTNPTNNATPENKFRWAYNVSTGIAHGNLLVDLANDVYMVTDQGIVSLSRFNISQQVGATADESVNPIIREYLKSVSESNLDYRKCKAFKYKNGPFCGFKIGSNKVLISLYSINLYSWSFFSGDFQNSDTIFQGSINSLYLAIGNKLYKYADGKDGGPLIYGDLNGSSFIQYWWTLPVIHKGGRFANKRYAINMQYSSAVARNTTNTLKIGIFGDLRKTFTLSNNYPIPAIGDSFNTVPLLETAENPNFPSPDDSGMRLDIPYATRIGRLKFVSSNFWLYLYGYTKDGPVYFDRISLFGIMERKS